MERSPRVVVVDWLARGILPTKRNQVDDGEMKTYG